MARGRADVVRLRFAQRQSQEIFLPFQLVSTMGGLLRYPIARPNGQIRR